MGMKERGEGKELQETRRKRKIKRKVGGLWK